MSGNFFESVLGSSGLVIGGAGGAIGGAIAGGAVGAGGGTLALPGGGTIAGGGYGAWVGGAAGGTAGAAAGYGAGSAGGAWIDQTRPGQYVNRKVDDFRDWLYANEKAEAAEGTGTVVCAGECSPPKADDPGEPSVEDGYVPPKKWDGKKVSNPNGSGKGWPDKNGDVWVPTGHGPTAHGGPHWDVQTPGGGYRNVYPGGRVR